MITPSVRFGKVVQIQGLEDALGKKSALRHQHVVVQFLSAGGQDLLISNEDGQQDLALYNQIEEKASKTPFNKSDNMNIGLFPNLTTFGHDLRFETYYITGQKALKALQALLSRIGK